jgi:hypothetical protein
MTKKFKLLSSLAYVGLFSASILSAQDKRLDVFTPGRDQTRFGPSMLCNDTANPASTNISLRLSLIIPGKQSYKIGEKALFEITVENSGNSTVEVPSEACSEKSSVAYQSGVLEACINLNYITPAGENDWFTGPCLCGREDKKDLTELEPGQSIVVRGGAEILTGGELFSTTYHGEKPTLLLQPDINFSRQHFPIEGGKRALDGCVDDIPARVEVENSASLQIAAGRHDKHPWDAPPNSK